VSIFLTLPVRLTTKEMICFVFTHLMFVLVTDTVCTCICSYNMEFP